MTYDRREVELILRAAAQIDDPQNLPITVDRDGLSMEEIQRIGAEAGIGARAISAATLLVALESAPLGERHLHHVHPIEGALDDDALNELITTIRGSVGLVDVKRLPDGLEFELGKKEGETGRLLVNIRSRDGATSVSIWSDAPHLGRGDVVFIGTFCVPLALFPVVAASSGQWPAIGLGVALAATSSAAGVAVAFAWQRWAAKRWRARFIRLLSPIIARATSLAANNNP